ncbi:MAG: MBOAT family protein, partial [Flavobacteriales bacterium]|nr:MBOAT family protein [Flavobacteriales bacterium]
LILFSTLVDYSVGVLLDGERNKLKRKFLLWTSIIVNLGLLGLFKYYNFFLDNFITAFSFFGGDIRANSLNIILPVGISFYTFQTLSYTIDVYKDKLKPTKDLLAFTAFVSFFPQLVAGPIERASDLLPQFYKKRVFEYDKAVDGLKQILWGLFKKIVIADNAAQIANDIFNNSADYSGSSLVLGAIFFTFQIYGDFSGYSDIAIGTSRLFGFRLKQNFAYPYFSRDFAEVWRRWHISLTSWFRDYVFIPMIQSKDQRSKWVKIAYIFILFFITGLWHGANWTFVIWGILHASFFIPSILSKKKERKTAIVAEGKMIPSSKELLQMTITFSLIVFTMIFFRAEDLGHAFSYISTIFSDSLFSIPEFTGKKLALNTAFLIVLFMLVEWLGRNEQYAIASIGVGWKAPLRYAMYYSIIFAIFFFMGSQQQFIYFQF